MCLLHFYYYYGGGGARFRRYSFQGWQCVFLSNVPEKGRRRPERISKKCGFDGGLAMGPMLSLSVVGFSSLSLLGLPPTLSPPLSHMSMLIHSSVPISKGKEGGATF